jgi:uncharacterized protein (TIGR02646 family)
MIKLTQQPKPVELTDAIVAELTDKYIKNKSSVWREEHIKEPIRLTLLKMSFGKCCYRECEINSEGSDLTVEHFYPAHIHKTKVLSWSNLLPACLRCNREKGILDTEKQSIIHPVNDDPKNHLELNQRLLLLYGKDELGDFTVDRLALNAERVALSRYKISLAVTTQLKELHEDISESFAQNSLTDKKEQKFYRELNKIMRLGVKESKYSAVISTVILTSPDYQEIKHLFEKNNLWNEEFSKLEQQVEFCALI